MLKLNAAGSAIVYGTYLGGLAGENGRDIAVDSAGTVLAFINLISVDRTEITGDLMRFEERIDQPRGQFFHTNWTGRGGTTASSAYVV